MNRQVVRDMLSIAGATMVEAPEAETGLRLAQEEVFDVILMDIRMPGMDGLQAIAELRKMAPPISNLPIIVITADTSADLKQRCEAVGADDVLMKPVALQQLLATLGRVVARDGGASVVLD